MTSTAGYTVEGRKPRSPVIEETCRGIQDAPNDADLHDATRPPARGQESADADAPPPYSQQKIEEMARGLERAIDTTVRIPFVNTAGNIQLDECARDAGGSLGHLLFAHRSASWISQEENDGAIETYGQFIAEEKAAACILERHCSFHPKEGRKNVQVSLIMSFRPYDGALRYASSVDPMRRIECGRLRHRLEQSVFHKSRQWLQSVASIVATNLGTWTGHNTQWNRQPPLAAFVDEIAKLCARHAIYTEEEGRPLRMQTLVELFELNSFNDESLIVYDLERLRTLVCVLEQDNEHELIEMLKDERLLCDLQDLSIQTPPELVHESKMRKVTCFQDVLDQISDPELLPTVRARHILSTMRDSVVCMLPAARAAIDALSQFETNLASLPFIPVLQPWNGKSCPLPPMNHLECKCSYVIEPNKKSLTRFRHPSTRANAVLASIVYDLIRLHEMPSGHVGIQVASNVGAIAHTEAALLGEFVAEDATVSGYYVRRALEAVRNEMTYEGVHGDDMFDVSNCMRHFSIKDASDMMQDRRNVDLVCDKLQIVARELDMFDEFRDPRFVLDLFDLVVERTCALRARCGVRSWQPVPVNLKQCFLSIRSVRQWDSNQKQLPIVMRKEIDQFPESIRRRLEDPSQKTFGRWLSRLPPGAYRGGPIDPTAFGECFVLTKKFATSLASF